MKAVFIMFQLGLLVMINLGCSSNSYKLAASSKATQIKPPAINQQLFDRNDIDIISEDEIFYLSAEQKSTFLNFYHQELEQGVKAHQALANFLENRLSNFTYYGETYTAEKAMRLNKGNCMSLAIFTTALAQLVNLEIDYREVNTLPVFEKHKDVILSSSHVQSVVYDPDFVEQENYLYISKPGIVIDYFPDKQNRVSSKIIKDSLVAKYYINIASKAIIDNNLNKAFVSALRAAKYDQSSAQINNLLAVLHRRAGDELAAEKFYQFALAQNHSNLALLSNYAVLLRHQKREGELEQINEQIDFLDDPNPYSWLEQAYIAQQQNKMKTAEKYFLKVINMSPYVHQAYIGLYQVYSQTKQWSQARAMLNKGLEWAHEHQDKKQFKRKLYSLNQT